MTVTGIVAEYNPFHTGHAYQIDKARECTGADFIVVVMSPDFVQRGEPAVFDKYTRTRMALLGGADLVLELPVCYATGSAEYFAEGSVSLLNSLGMVNFLCFGGESDRLLLFQALARILADEPDEYRQLLVKFTSDGLSFPLAREQSLTACISGGCTNFFQGYTHKYTLEYTHGYTLDSDPVAAQEAFLEAMQNYTPDFLRTPNNILGIEYCRALYRSGSFIRPVPVKRIGSEYNSTDLGGSFCSATALRSAIFSGTLGGSTLNGNSLQQLQPYIPDACWEIFRSASEHAVTAGDFLPYLTLKLLESRQYSQILDIGNDLSDRILRMRSRCIGKSYPEIISLLKTRQLTESRIRRCLLHLILNIRQDQTDLRRENGGTGYARILGFRKSAAPLLHELKTQSSVPLIAKPAQAAERIDSSWLEMWNQDVYASHLYRSTVLEKVRRKSSPDTVKNETAFRTEYEMSPIIL